MAGMNYFGPRGDGIYYQRQSRKNYNVSNERQFVDRRPERGIVPRPSNIDIQPSLPALIPTQAFEDEQDAQLRKYVGTGVGFATLIMENLLSHPFVVLRRQCQVNHKSKKYHIVPITLIPVIIHLHQRQGITTLWKGIGSTLLVRGMTLAIEDIISKITPWPKEIQWHKHSLKEISQHIILKCVTLAIVTPFYSASLVETVQSDIASEKPGIFDVFKEGLCRLISWSSPQKGRMLPIWAIVVPNVTHGLLKYYFSLIIKTVTVGMLHIHHKKNEIKLQGVFPKDWSNHSTVHDIEASAQLISLVAADAFFFPLETILHRLQLQGTRTLIDNMDSGQDVVAILTSYEGANDCYLTSLDQEGSGGLYKGFGALVLQFTVHFAVIKLARYLLTQAVVYFRQIPPPAESQPPRNLSQERLPQWSMNR